MPDLGAINWLAVLVAVVAMQVVGFLWYGPLFSKTWLAASGKTREDVGANSTPIIVSIIASVLSAVALAIILTMSDTPDLVSGIKIGLLTSIGLVAASVVVQGSYEDRNPTLTWLYCGFLIVSLTAMGAIIGAWQ